MSITIRKPSMVDKTLDELEAEGAFDQVENVDASGTLHPYEVELLALKKSNRIKEFLKLAMQHGLTLVIVGKTGSGKTTIGKSITNCIPTDERLVTVEDVHEMFLNHHPNKVHLFYSRDGEGSLSINPKQAIASCLRMKPDRILLTEMRGDEAWEFVKAVGSGHPGISTAHAGGALEAFDQIVALIKDSATGAHLDAAYIKKRVLRRSISCFITSTTNYAKSTMTLNLSENNWVKAVVIIALVAVVTGVWAYLAGGIFLMAFGHKFEESTPLTLYQYWFYYGAEKQAKNGSIFQAAFRWPCCWLHCFSFSRMRKKPVR
ncbi:P-type DNA transfer ATPase VirB11 (plasmid) [Xylella fastidiosa subsp. pauca]|uniref:P-type DNA transfer ATPase VirB11 n=1 Tax=Xylella fastidiosa TaxID=2371 RepID=UPI00241F6F65|nr:P-type DNA transfer ATPase VirB11 [Xylella fastidiosa]MDG5824406.1 P-type DNA transfer ATPase VirB11 [Xylella fastidiosa subsp. pauca]